MLFFFLGWGGCYWGVLAQALAAVFGFWFFWVWLRPIFFVLSSPGGGSANKAWYILCDGFWTYHVHIPACDQPAVFFFSLYDKFRQRGNLIFAMSMCHRQCVRACVYMYMCMYMYMFHVMRAVIPLS